MESQGEEKKSAELPSAMHEIGGCNLTKDLQIAQLETANGPIILNASVNISIHDLLMVMTDSAEVMTRVTDEMKETKETNTDLSRANSPPAGPSRLNAKPAVAELALPLFENPVDLSSALPAKIVDESPPRIIDEPIFESVSNDTDIQNDTEGASAKDLSSPKSESGSGKQRGQTGLSNPPAEDKRNMSMTIFHWKEMERDCIAAGGAESLAFKLVRDAFMSPHGIVKEDLISISSILGRVPFKPDKNNYLALAVADLPLCEMCPNGGQGLQSNEEMSTLNRVVSVVMSGLNPFFHTVSEREPLFDESPRGDYEQTFENDMDLIVNDPTGGALYGQSRFLLKREEHGPGKIEVHNSMDPACLAPNSVMRDQTWQRIQQYQRPALLAGVRSCLKKCRLLPTSR
jgi:hypothetical protein